MTDGTKVFVSLERSYNLGDYQSLKIAVGVTLPVQDHTTEAIELTADDAAEIASKKLREFARAAGINNA